MSEMELSYIDAEAVAVPTIPSPGVHTGDNTSIHPKTTVQERS